MERIKQALEKARQERLQNESSAAVRPDQETSAASPSRKINYTQTRTISIPIDLVREKRVLVGQHQDTYSEAYKILRTQVLQRLRDNNWNVIAITSPGTHEGKTLTAINLAISLSMEVNYTVLLVDADLRHPEMHTYFGIEPQYGLSDYLMTDMPLTDLLVHPEGIPGLVLLPGGTALSNSSEMLNSPKMSRLVEELRNRYPSRIVLFDLPQLLSAADALAFSPYVDATLLVLEEGKTKSDDAVRAVELLKNTNLIGTILNKSQTRRADKDSSVQGKIPTLHKAAAKLMLWGNRLMRKFK